MRPERQLRQLASAGAGDLRPIAHVLIVFVLWVGEDFEQIGVPGCAAAILRRAASGSVKQARVLDFRRDWSDLLQFDCVLPIISEVVDVANLGAGSGQDLGKMDLAFHDDIARLIVGRVRTP